MYRHGFIPDYGHTARRRRRRGAGIAARSSQHDAGRLAEPVTKTDATAGVAAVRSDCRHHARGLGDGPLVPSILISCTEPASSGQELQIDKRH